VQNPDGSWTPPGAPTNLPADWSGAVTVKNGQGVLAALKAAGVPDVYAAYGQLARTGQLDFDAKNMPMVRPGQQLYLDSAIAADGDNALGRNLTTGEGVERNAIAERLAKAKADSDASYREMNRLSGFQSDNQDYAAQQAAFSRENARLAALSPVTTAGNSSSAMMAAAALGGEFSVLSSSVPSNVAIPNSGTSSIQADPGWIASMGNIVGSDASIGQKLGIAWDQTKYYFRGSDAAQGGVQALGGVGEVAGAIGLGGTGVGAVVAFPLAFHGGDNIGTGLTRMFTDAPQDTVTYSGVDSLTGSPRIARAVDNGIPFVGGIAGIGAGVNALNLQGRIAFADGPGSNANFASESLLNGHFEKHGAEFRTTSPDDYLNVGRDIMNNGQPIDYFYGAAGENRTGYVSFLRNRSSNGEALFGFVGTNSDGFITTVHVKSRTDLFDLLGDQSQSTLKAFRTDTIGPNPQNGWKWPYSR